jgi:hypothetical protein
MSILYREPSTDAFYQVSVHLTKRFQRQKKNATLGKIPKSNRKIIETEAKNGFLLHIYK